MFNEVLVDSEKDSRRLKGSDGQIRKGITVMKGTPDCLESTEDEIIPKALGSPERKGTTK